MNTKRLIWAVPVLALLGGAAAGNLMVRQPEATADAEDGPSLDGETGEKTASAPEKDVSPAAWFKFPNQFFVPIVRRGEIDGMMVLTLTVETTEKGKPAIEAQEHRLRDALLRSLIIHANTGGFAGNYTADPKMQQLRESLLTTATKVAGADAHAVLIEDLARSDR
ncbi:hypothetical protein FNJ84_01995 [Paracoccus sp. M683]|uniref:hypothetical protein n=1 Tax=Paracoccus sp. M683 TaxID=2594268 RepID=UPI00117E1C07|nr:hypothetical protein [Paracoccus sp. M683]TRW99468.1 hypothetical protein FNJ84_01995 [Paracoccus sp. M683]